MKLSASDISNLDKSISELINCIPLPEADGKHLCDKAILNIIKNYFLLIFYRQKKF
mgnify:CR=1 FL=1